MCAPRARLLCLPYAGASAQIFRSWRRWLAPHVDLLAPELPARGLRLRLPAYEHMDDLVSALAATVAPRLDLPLAIFGHGLGALVAFELCRALSLGRDGAVRHLFVSAQLAPHLSAGVPRIHQMPAAQLAATLRARQGAAPSDLEEMGDLLLPALRADWKLAEEYQFRPGPRLRSPITVFAGIDDPSVGRHELSSWGRLTRDGCTVYRLSGNHFFIHEHQRLLATIMLRALHLESRPAAAEPPQGCGMEAMP